MPSWSTKVVTSHFHDTEILSSKQTAHSRENGVAVDRFTDFFLLGRKEVYQKRRKPLQIRSCEVTFVSTRCFTRGSAGKHEKEGL